MKKEEDKENEIWKIIVDDIDFKDAYMVSNKGRIKSSKRKINSRYGKYKTLPDKILSLNKDKNTHYVSITLSLDLKRYTRSIHRLVAKAFIINLENKCSVNHKDGDRTNNNLENLEWVTKSENALHGKSNSRKKNSWTREEVIEIINNFSNSDEIAFALKGTFDKPLEITEDWIEKNL